MIRLLDRRREHHHQRVADDAVDGPLVLEGDADHLVQVFVEQRDDRRGIALFHQRREVGEVGEHERAFAPLAAEAQLAGIADQMLDEIRRDVAAEGLTDPAPLALRADVPVDRAGDEDRGQAD